MTYIEHDVKDGRLENILYPDDYNVQCTPRAYEHDTNGEQPSESTDGNTASSPHRKAMVVSLHSCGNLSHHGIRSLVLNPSVTAVAMIGCCYNLLTERLGPATYKLPQLRPNHPRLEATGSAYDPHGFPMSHTLANFPYEAGGGGGGRGVKLNITARMMAVQAPYRIRGLGRSYTTTASPFSTTTAFMLLTQEPGTASKPWTKDQFSCCPSGLAKESLYDMI
ncbi:hypothetical protein PV11_00788 [Exophiala sideris]|uniref:Methyltransferase domain-containing protein n=1 Tax=Exophiala sideris TaxID=1016849 RepID=A0A0D1YQP3_9EURO|nr:hypothetical protein PV11_00788 [Exophiala sideris]